jgi:tRNA (guanine-N7-)-methyltransferase
MEMSESGKNHHQRPSNGAPTRLPLNHPDYRYSVSRNPYSAKVQELQGRVYSDNDAELHKGSWLKHFPDSERFAGKPEHRPLHVEIGCNAGHVVVEWAARDPQTAFVGIDWKFKPVHRAAEKGIKRKIDNLIFLRAHADRLQFMFGSEEIDFLALYFPDPWAKKAQLKNRWFTAQRLREVAPVVRKGGIFHIKTDHLGYFEWMEKQIAEVGDLWEVVEHTRDLHTGNPHPDRLQIPEITLFEGLFIKDGIKINSVKIRRK